jgi:hypothetical protein
MRERPATPTLATAAAATIHQKYAPTKPTSSRTATN